LAGFVAQKLKTFAIEKETFINVNFPDCEPQKFGSVVYLPSNVGGAVRITFINSNLAINKPNASQLSQFNKIGARGC